MIHFLVSCNYGRIPLSQGTTQDFTIKAIIPELLDGSLVRLSFVIG